MILELKERKDKLFNKRKLLNVILHKEGGTGIPVIFSDDQQKQQLNKEMTDAELNEITHPDIPVR